MHYLSNIFLIIVSFSSFGQIAEVIVHKREIKETYDSSRDYLGGKYKQYIGQELYVKGKTESLRKYGYENFSTQPLANFLDRKSIYKCCEGESFNSKYEDLHGKYFLVLDVINLDRFDEVEFKLQDKPTGDLVYFRYKIYPDNYFGAQKFPFVVVGHFLKEKKSPSERDLQLARNHQRN